MKIQKNNIILIGMPGSGKTTTAKTLSSKLQTDFIDLDLMIENLEGLKITEIFKKKGEEYFRRLETEALLKLFSKDETFVLAAGGGTVEKNMEILKELGLVFYLEILPEYIYQRIKDDKSRPLLQKENPKAALEEIYQRRKKFYEKADFKIDAKKCTDEVADRIIYERANCKNRKQSV